MQRVTILGTALLFCLSSFAQQPSANPTTPPANASNTVGDPHEELSPETPADKAAAYDKWPEQQRINVSKAMGHDLRKLSSRERAEALAKMTPKEKADAYDYYITHPTAKKKTK